MKIVMKTLNELGSVRRGKSKHRPRDASHLYDGPYPFIQTSDVKNAGLYITDYTQTYSAAGLAQSKLWKTGTLCITIAANIGDASILSFDACFPDSIIGFISDPQKSDARYIKYLFDAVLQKSFKRFTQGSAQDNLSQEKLLSLKLPVAEDVQDQILIADILSSYDELININRRRIQLLEESARLLFREWFVYFRFPGHEKAKIVDGVPKGWEKRILIEVANITMGQSPKSEYYNDNGEGLPFHQGVTGFGNRYPTNQTYCTQNNRMAQAGDILFSVRAPVGRINISTEKIIIGRGVSAIRSKENHQSYLFYELKNHFFKEDMIGGGAIFAAITKKDLETVVITYPDEKMIEQFENITNPIDRQIEILSIQNQKLAHARDFLLPRLMSGAIEA